ncbi:MAG: histidine phosphatase family protein [Pseudomonadota bacterium]
MPRLILMRHAKSDWLSGAASDHDRPLNPRGQRAATALGRWLNAQALIPDTVLCSSAARTRETLARLALAGEPQTTFTRDLYLAPAKMILQTLRGAQGDTVLMLGHNPGIAEAAENLLSDAPQTSAFQDYPTGATLVADFNVPIWSEVDWDTGSCTAFTTPKELA